jgi:hypothetical protein
MNYNMQSEKKNQILLYTSHLLFYHGEICVSNGQQMSYLKKRETKAIFSLVIMKVTIWTGAVKKCKTKIDHHYRS